MQRATREDAHIKLTDILGHTATSKYWPPTHLPIDRTIIALESENTLLRTQVEIRKLLLSRIAAHVVYQGKSISEVDRIYGVDIRIHENLDTISYVKSYESTLATIKVGNTIIVTLKPKFE